MFRSSTYVDFRQKLTWRLAQSLLRRFEVLHLLPELADFFADPTRIRLGNIGFSPICRLHRAKISRDALIDLLQARLDLRARKVAIAIVDGLELVAIDGQEVRSGRRLQYRRRSVGRRRAIGRLITPSPRHSRLPEYDGAI
ncbi:hypothetical protein [Paraburkholderia fungorum]|uniref:hypothetical protein n=1 Tax=Paraburkholderia fungorum TaxID=134537 RepID=UPI0011EA64D4|nr:hypothetical protein [Paraburkholderia fungorum]